MPPGAYGAPIPAAGDMSSLNSGVRNMSVDENGGFMPPHPPAEPLPGVLPQHYAQQQQQQYAAQYGQNPNLLRSNSYQ